MFWLIIVIGVFALVAIFTTHGNDKRRRDRRLEQIQKRLAEKEAKSNAHDDDPG